MNKLQEDMLEVAERVLGPRSGKHGQELWWEVDDPASLSGQAVTDGYGNYFVYGKDIDRGMAEPPYGLQRVTFTQDGSKKFSIATQAIRSAEEEYRRFPNNRESTLRRGSILLRLFPGRLRSG